MELQSNIILLLTFLSGISGAAGIISLSIGIRTRSKLYTCFGIISLLSASYYGFAVISSTITNPYTSAIGLVSFVITFAMLPWFIKVFFELKNKLFPTISSTILSIAIVIFMIGKLANYDNGLWEIIAHAGVFIYVFYVLYVVVKNNERLSAKKRFTLATVVTLMFLFLVDNLFAGYAPDYRYWSNMRWPLPIDYYLFVFLLIMGSNLIADFKRKDFLEKEVKIKAENWENLIGNIRLITMQLDKNFNVQNINPYFSKTTGYQLVQLQEKNWINKVYPTKDLEKKEEIYKSLNWKNNNLSYIGEIITSQGKVLTISWSIVAQYDHKKEFAGLIGIGEDITEREQAYLRIEELKILLEQENLVLKEKLHSSIINETSQVLGESHAANYAHEKALEVAPTQSIVLLEGETGVGKEVFARLIHENSQRNDQEFLKINCSAIPHDLIESELFGHEKGAFTGAGKMRRGIFERASGGTLFLDEIGELPLDLQPKLLRVLQDGELQRVGGEQTITTNVRIIAATNRVLADEIEKGTFRKDLYFRINVFPITIPPLRKRQEDIPLFIAHFVQLYASKYEKVINRVSKHTYESFGKYHWPGNIRELQNVIERAVILAKSDILKTNGLLQEKPAKSTVKSELPIYSLEELERQHIINVLKESNWQVHGKKGAAKKLEINPNTLRSRMKKLNIERLN